MNKSMGVFAGLIAGVFFLSSFKKKDSSPSNTEGANVPDSQKPTGQNFAFFNKNFGNIRNAGKRYPWEITPQGNTYKKFKTWEGGAAAFITHFKRYILGDVMNGKLNTISKILHTWAPTSENDTEGYIAFVEKNSGYNRNYIITTKDATAIMKITAVMSKMEGGATSTYYTDAVFKKAWSMSLKEFPQYA